MKEHVYDVQMRWTGNDGEGTKSYRGYRRDYTITSAGKPELLGSSDPEFCGDPGRYNPEELLVASISSCHMLWYLHLCAVNRVRVLEYRDEASGVMRTDEEGGGAFVRVVLKPRVAISGGSDEAKAIALHHEAHRLCFIANSMNFPIATEPEVVRVADSD